MSDVALEQVIDLAFKLSVTEQATLLERVAAHLADKADKTALPVNSESEWTDEELRDLLVPGSPKSGAEIAAMIESGELDTNAWSEMMDPHIADSVEWVKALRQDMNRKRPLDLGQ